MKPSLKIQAILLALLLAGCGKKASDVIDFGTINNSVYKNNYFQMTARIPPDWSVQDKNAQNRLLKQGGALIAGDDKNLASEMKASELQSVYLITAFKYAPGSPVEFNPSIMSVAEDVGALPGIKRGKDYLFHARKLLESSQIQATFPTDVFTKKVGGVDFDVMDVEIAVGSKVVRQEYYSTIMKGYALSFITSYGTDEDKAALQSILDTVTFN